MTILASLQFSGNLVWRRYVQSRFRTSARPRILLGWPCIIRWMASLSMWRRHCPHWYQMFCHRDSMERSSINCFFTSQVYGGWVLLADAQGSHALELWRWLPLFRCAPAPSSIVPAAIEDSSSSSLKILAVYRADPDRPFQTDEYYHFKQLSSRLKALSRRLISLGS